MELDDLAGKIREAAQAGTALRFRGGGSKDFYGGLLAGDVLEVGAYQGVVAYEPTELYVTARCGTPLAEVETLLAAQGQMLAFEPPRFGTATVGGCVAAGLSGPRRMQAGAVRDFVLGVKLIDGQGQVLDFGGQVMKNVAGYDISRFLAGSLGTLGLLAEVTLKVLPKPVEECSLVFEMDQTAALLALNRWGGQPLPISASFWHDGKLTLRLSGARAAVVAACHKLGGELLADGEPFWESIREQSHAAFQHQLLWRLALPSTAPVLALPGITAVEWGGGLRWLAGEVPAETVREVARQAGGHGVLYRAQESLRTLEGAFVPLSPALMALHRRLKQVFDPRGICNPGRLYGEL